ncbi:MAG: hypothetical protein IKR04_04350 [Clostridia bacterium]|nr:hypothetical protein [Clostridia bacterium]
MDTNDNKNFAKIIYIIVFAIIIATGMYIINHKEPAKLYKDTSVDSGEVEKKSSIALEDANILYDTKFGGVYVKTSIPYFNALGFEYGDSVDVEFSNGYRLDDIPYYDGYYTKSGDPLVVAYPGSVNIKVGLNSGEDLWILAGLSGDELCTIRMNEEGKYLDNQQVMDIQISGESGDFSGESGDF